MSNDSAPPDSSPSSWRVFDALDDSDCRTILRETAEPTTANELIDASDIANSTMYRKLRLLSRASLVREIDTIGPDGGRITRYERNFADIAISMDEDDDFSVTIKRPSREMDKRFADLWSEIGDEL